MSWTLGQVKARVRNLLDDPQGSYLTDDFIVPLINEVYADANSQLTSTQSSFDINVVEVPGHHARHSEHVGFPGAGRSDRPPRGTAAAHRLESSRERSQLLPACPQLWRSA